MSSKQIVAKAFERAHEYFNNIYKLHRVYYHRVSFPSYLICGGFKIDDVEFGDIPIDDFKDFSRIEYCGRTITRNIETLEGLGLLDFKNILTILLLNLPVQSMISTMNVENITSISLKSPAGVIKAAITHVNDIIEMDINYTDYSETVERNNLLKLENERLNDQHEELDLLRLENERLKEQLENIRTMIK